MRFSSSSSSVNNESFRDNCGGFNLSFFVPSIDLISFTSEEMGTPQKLDLFSGAQKFLVSFYSPNKMQGDFFGILKTHKVSMVKMYRALRTAPPKSLS